jgi:hypothetical protein
MVMCSRGLHVREELRFDGLSSMADAAAMGNGT